jgi:hypothetical protein
VYNTQKQRAMKRYYIIDNLGVRHGIVNANSDIQAINLYKKDMPEFIEYYIIAVRDEELKLLIKNLKKL